MEKRSKGVTIFGWLFIIAGVLGILTHLNVRAYFEIAGSGILRYVNYFLGFIMAVCSLIAGLNILKLKFWARRLAIILCTLSIVSLLVSFKSSQNSQNFQDEAFYTKQKQIIREQIKPEYQQEALEKLERTRQASEQIFPIFFCIVTIIGIVWNLITIYFFTRPKVKEQFS